MTEPTEPQSRQIVTKTEATENSLKTYFTGSPCKRGHVSSRYLTGGECTECVAHRNNIRRTSDPAKRKAEKHAEYLRNIETYNAQIRRRNIASPGANRARASAWQKSNPERVRTNQRNRSSRQRNAEGFHTAKEIADLFVKQKARCAYYRVCGTKINLGKNGCHADHIVALAKGGTNWISNIQLTCGPCNSSKKAKDPLVFARQLGLLL